MELCLSVRNASLSSLIATNGVAGVEITFMNSIKIYAQDLINNGFYQVSRKFRLLARFPKGLTGKQALSMIDPNLGKRLTEGDAGDHYLRIYASPPDLIEVDQETMDEFRRLGGSTYEGPRRQRIFVFGSNLAGRHSDGSARRAYEQCGAVWGVGEGLQGRSYAIPTKDANLSVLSLSQIKTYVDRFIEFATNHQEMEFEVVRIGCGLAGYTDEQIAPMFKLAPDNCILPTQWYWEILK